MKALLAGVVLAASALAGGPGAASAPQGSAPPAERREKGLDALLHLQPDAVRALLGAPVVEREEGRGALWTYQAPDCALLIFFRDQGGLRVSGAAAGPRRRGASVPDPGSCLKSVLAAKASAP